MGKNEFINILINGLISIPKEQRDDIIYQYEEHFNIELSNGKSEAEIIQELGSPYEIIERYKGKDTSSTTSYIHNNESKKEDDKKNYKNKNYSNNKINNYENINNEKKKSQKSIFTIMFILIIGIISFPGIIGAIFTIIAVLVSGIIFSIALTFSSVLIFFGKVLNSGHLKDMFGSVIDQIPASSTVFFLIGNIALTILIFIIVFQILKLTWKLLSRFFNWLRSAFN